jgi:hypothetical protein
VLKIRGIWLALLLASLAGLTAGCKELDKGVYAYYEGNFPKALRFLDRIAEKFHGNPPPFNVIKDDGTLVNEVVPSLTLDTYRFWMAYAGSHLGLGDEKRACDEIGLALRPITIRVNDRELASFDPTSDDENVDWPQEVYILRSWWLNVPCQK